VWTGRISRETLRKSFFHRRVRTRIQFGPSVGKRVNDSLVFSAENSPRIHPCSRSRALKNSCDFRRAIAGLLPVPNFESRVYAACFAQHQQHLQRDFQPHTWLFRSGLSVRHSWNVAALVWRRVLAGGMFQRNAFFNRRDARSALAISDGLWRWENQRCARKIRGIESQKPQKWRHLRSQTLSKAQRNQKCCIINNGSHVSK
jgi:hypothetical protein